MKLIIEDDEGHKTIVPIIREDVEITIGRQEGNTIRLTERNVSRRHAKLARRSGAVYVEDLASYNGIKINGDRVAPGPCRITQGDLVEIGDYDLAIVEDDQASLSPREAHQANNEREITAQIPLGSPSSSGYHDLPTEPGIPIPEPLPQAIPRKHVSTAIINPAQVKRGARRVTDIPIDSAPRLQIVSTELSGREFACIRTEIKIGRTEDNDIAIDHRSLSRNHCKVVREESGEWKVIDLESANGVKVDGETYAECPLKYGSVIDLGHLRFKFLPPGNGAIPTLHHRPRRNLLLPVGLGVGAAIVLLLAAILLMRPKPTSEVLTDPRGADAPQAAAPESAPPAPHPPPSAPPTPAAPAVDPKLAAEVELGRELLASGRFSEAVRRLQSARDGGAADAEPLLRKARAELDAQARLVEAQKKLSAGNREGARAELAAIPPDSVAAKRAQEMLDKLKPSKERSAPREQPRAAEPAPKANKPAEDAWAEEDEEAAADPREQAAADLETGKGLASPTGGKQREAITYLERALKGDSSLVEAHLYLGTCYAMLKQIKKGAYHYEEYVHLRPEDPQAVKVRAILREYYRQTGEKPRWPLPEE